MGDRGGRYSGGLRDLANGDTVFVPGSSGLFHFHFNGESLNSELYHLRLSHSRLHPLGSGPMGKQISGRLFDLAPSNKTKASGSCRSTTCLVSGTRYIGKSAKSCSGSRSAVQTLKVSVPHAHQAFRFHHADTSGSRTPGPAD